MTEAAPLSRAAQWRDCLALARERVRAELRLFPPAVPVCDAQFNHLLERRDTLGRALGRLDDILAAEIDADGRTRLLAAFRRDHADCCGGDDAR